MFIILFLFPLDLLFFQVKYNLCSISFKFIIITFYASFQAIVFYELAFHFNPHCAEACNNLGVIYKDRDNLDKAVECYQERFCYLWIFVIMPFLFFSLLKFLVILLQMALSIKPNFSQSLNNLGVVYTVQVHCLLSVINISLVFLESELPWFMTADRVKWTRLQAWLRKLSLRTLHMPKHITT